MKIFPKNSRVCFVGDSITHNNGFISHIVGFYNEHYKDRNINFYNCGVSGGHVSTLFPIFEDDILSHNPTHAVIMLGMNDSERLLLLEKRDKQRYEKLLNAFDLYKKNLAELCEKFKEKQVEIILCTPTPYDEYQESETEVLPGGFALIEGYADYVRKFAQDNGFALCDYHKYLSRKIQEAALINSDRVHPSDVGHYYMAKCFLLFQGLEIGENKKIPEYMNRWRELVEIYRNIRATEYFIVKDYTLSFEERIESVQRYIDEESGGIYREYFIELAQLYLKYKPKQKDIEDELNYIMEKSFKE